MVSNLFFINDEKKKKYYSSVVIDIENFLDNIRYDEDYYDYFFSSIKNHSLTDLFYWIKNWVIWSIFSINYYFFVEENSRLYNLLPKAKYEIKDWKIIVWIELQKNPLHYNWIPYSKL